MTELEKLERAKGYIDKLANGINPVDDSAAPDEDTINDVRVSRCFFYVSNVLQQVIENGGIEPTKSGKKVGKRSLEVPLEKRNQFSYATKPISASEIAKRVNDLVDDEKMRKLNYSDIAAWLLESGMLECTVASNGRRIKRPTKKGIASGISVEDRTGDHGRYQVVVYDTAGQHFVIDHLDEILAAKGRK